MDNESVQIIMSKEEFRQLTQLFQTFQNALPGGPTAYQPVGRFWTVDERCQYRWPLATPRQRRRIRDVCFARYREQLGRHPFKLTGHANGVLVIEEEHLAILDRAIDIVRNEEDGRDKYPLFRRRPR